MDLFADIMDTLRMKGVLYFHANFTAPWALQVPRLGEVARFHLIAGGACWVTVDGGPPLHLSNGDLILVSHGLPHVVSDVVGREPTLVDDVVSRTGFTGAGTLVYSAGAEPAGSSATTSMVCGHLAFDDGLRHPVLGELPPVMIVRAGETLNDAWIASVVRFITHEVQEQLSGAEAVVKRLSEILFIQVARLYLKEAGAQARFIGALKDESISRALKAIHEFPARPWTVESLAREAHQSRAVFAARFETLVGVPPIRYLAQWRMLKAAQLLRDSDRLIKTVAATVGYRSEPAFTRAFTQAMHLSPAEYRKEHRSPGPVGLDRV